MCSTDPTRIAAAAATGGLSEAGGIPEAIKAGQKGLGSAKRGKLREQASAKQAKKRKGERRIAKTAAIRSEQISKFNTNVAAGGSKRAANIG